MPCVRFCYIAVNNTVEIHIVICVIIIVQIEFKEVVSCDVKFRSTSAACSHSRPCCRSICGEVNVECAVLAGISGLHVLLAILVSLHGIDYFSVLAKVHFCRQLVVNNKLSC